MHDFGWKRVVKTDEDEFLDEITVRYEPDGYGGGARPYSPPGWYVYAESCTRDGGAIMLAEERGPFPSSLIALLNGGDIFRFDDPAAL